MALVRLNMFCGRAWLCFIGMQLLRVGSEATFISFPRNEMSLTSNSVEFQCSTDSDKPLTWSVTYSDRSPGLPDYRAIALFIRGNLTSVGESKYRIDTSIPGQYNLIIDSVDFSYAGKYKCTESSFGPEVEAELAVIDSQPTCQANASNTDNSIVEDDYLWIQCNVNFSGNVNPRTSWIRNSTGNVQQNSVNDRHQSMIVIQVHSSDNGETFTFKATFRQENNSHQIVVMWNYTAKVLYMPRDLVINPIRNVYEVGDLLTCSADGNPTPSYKWTETGKNRTIHGSILIIEDQMKSDQNHSFSCTAYNTVAGLTWYRSETVTFSVTGSTLMPSDTSGLTVQLLIVVSLTIFCFIPLIGYICFRVYNNIKWKRQEALEEAQYQSELNRELKEETTIAKEHSQQQETPNQSLGIEGNYADLTNRSFSDQQYSRLHIYANASVNTSAADASAAAEYANQED